MKLNSQCNTILKAMLNDPAKNEWMAKDFQSGEYFVGYEASARMSDLKRLYPTLMKVGQKGRFRTLSINWDDKETIDFIKLLLGDE